MSNELIYMSAILIGTGFGAYVGVSLAFGKLGSAIVGLALFGLIVLGGCLLL